MKKYIITIIALALSAATGLAQTGSVTTSEFIVNSGSAPILISGSTKATGTLTLNAQPSAGDVIVLGSGTYTYKTALTGTNQILINSGSLAGTITNTVNAINMFGTNDVTFDVGGANTSGSAAGSGNTVAVTALAAGTAANSVATTGTFVSPSNAWGAATLTGGAVASGTDTVYTLPANGGDYVLTAVDVVYLSGSVTYAPSAAIQTGSGTVLTGTMQLTGTTANNLTHFTAAATPLPVVVTGTNPMQLQLKITTTGTASVPFMGKVFIKGYWLALP